MPRSFWARMQVELLNRFTFGGNRGLAETSRGRETWLDRAYGVEMLAP